MDDSLILGHLAGSVTLAVYAVDPLYCSKGCCWDFDEGVKGLAEVEAALKALWLHPVREGARPGRDGHLWLFFSEPVPAQELIDFNQELVSALELPPGLEFYPAADRHGYAGRFSQMRLPLGVHRKPGTDSVRGLFADVEPDIRAQVDFINSQPFDRVDGIKRVAKIRAKKREAQAIEVERRRQIIKPVHVERSNSLVDLLQVIPVSERILVKDWWRTRCPACAESGHDQAGDNLHINAGDGTRFKCWKGHVNGGNGHSALEIVIAAQGCRN